MEGDCEERDAGAGGENREDGTGPWRNGCWNGVEGTGLWEKEARSRTSDFNYHELLVRQWLVLVGSEGVEQPFSKGVDGDVGYRCVLVPQHPVTHVPSLWLREGAAARVGLQAWVPAPANG